MAPAGTLLPLSLALDQNVEALLTLLQRQHSIDGLWLLQQRFIAGSMLLGRLDALQPLEQLGLKLSDFEPEAGQTDGTLAHGLERWLSLAALLEGGALVELPGPPIVLPGFAYGWVG
jgi:lipopolysaccharide biosynthesis protein